MTDMWKLGYELMNGRRRVRAITSMLWPYYQKASQRLLEEHPCDLIVSVHPISNGPILRTMGQNHCPFVTVVTDMVTTHAFWYHRKADLVIVPTELARRRGIQYGLDPQQITVIGLPVAQRFCYPEGDRAELRRRLGWPSDLPVILLVGGGEGMGPLERTAYAIDVGRLPAALVIVAGRNAKLRSNLEAHDWTLSTTIYGFVHTMPDFMRAADIIVTKAGPGTINEAFIAGLPMILYSRVPGQEEGNVDYVVSEGAGVWAPHPSQVVDALRDWLENPSHRQRAADASRRLARPQAATEIACLIARMAGIRE